MEPSVADILAALDKDHDGKISKEEFMDYWYNEKIAKAEAWTDAEVAEAGAEFDRADTSHDGHVDIPELIAAMSEGEEHWSTHTYIIINCKNDEHQRR